MTGPRLAVGPGGRLGAHAAGAYEWVLHRRAGGPVAFLASPLAGLGAGEELDAHVGIAAGANAALTTQGPTSLLRTASPARHRWRLDLGPEAHLTYLPWATVPFAGSRASLETEAVLAEGATLVAWELLAAGRVAMGERFELAELTARVRISAAGAVLLDERLALRAGDAAAAAVLLGGRTHVGTLYVAGVPEQALPAERARAAVVARAELAGATRPEPGLLLVRALDRSAERLERALWPVVQEARRVLALPELEPADLARGWRD